MAASTITTSGSSPGSSSVGPGGCAPGKTEDWSPHLRLAITTTVASLFLIPVADAAAARFSTSSREALRWSPPKAWLRQALCIHRHESHNWHRAGIDWRGRRSPYYGGMQFLVSTWRAAGGKGLPSDWPAHEQLYRAWRIWTGDGGSWRQWGTAGRCGLA